LNAYVVDANPMRQWRHLMQNVYRKSRKSGIIHIILAVVGAVKLNLIFIP